ncbi:adenylate kinase, partial [Halobacteriales archaeon SW_7_68_16]
MRVAVTGTPGTGKTAATELLTGDSREPGTSDDTRESAESRESGEHPTVDLDVVHLNDAIHAEGLTTGHDEERDSAVADVDAV